MKKVRKWVKMGRQMGRQLSLYPLTSLCCSHNKQLWEVGTHNTQIEISLYPLLLLSSGQRTLPACLMGRWSLSGGRMQKCTCGMCVQNGVFLCQARAGQHCKNTRLQASTILHRQWEALQSSCEFYQVHLEETLVGEKLHKD